MKLSPYGKRGFFIFGRRSSLDGVALKNRRTSVRNENVRGRSPKRAISGRLHLRVPFADSDRESRTENKGARGRRGKNRGAHKENNKNGGSSKASEVPKSHMTSCFSSICQTHVSLFFSPVSRARRVVSLFLSPPLRGAPPHFALFLRGRNLGAFCLIELSPRASTSFPFAAEDKLGEHRGMMINSRTSPPSCAFSSVSEPRLPPELALFFFLPFFLFHVNPDGGRVRGKLSSNNLKKHLISFNTHFTLTQQTLRLELPSVLFFSFRTSEDVRDN